MKQAWLLRLKKLFKRQSWTNTKTKVRLSFLGLSLLLWFLIKLSKPGYVEIINFSIDYSELPPGMVFTKEPPKALKLKLKGTGFDLIKYAWFSFRDLDIDLSSLQTDRKGRTYWTSATAADYLEAQLSDETTGILDISPDTVFFNMSRLVTKKLPVALNLNFKFDTTAYVLYGQPVLSKDSVVVEAPADVLAKLSRIETEVLGIEEPADSLERGIALKVPQFPHLRLNDKAIQVQLKFSALTEGVMQIPVQAINVPDTVIMELFPSQVNLRFRCALRDFKDIRPEEFLIYADFLQIKDRKERRFLYLSLENPPSQIRSVQFQPKRVEYLLKKP